MSHRNGCHTSSIVTKTKSCPHCIMRKRRGNLIKERGWKIGKIEIIVNCTNGDSNEKEMTCPICKRQIRFSYKIDKKTGKPRIRVVS